MDAKLVCQTVGVDQMHPPATYHKKELMLMLLL
jgi:hypothetical protein